MNDDVISAAEKLADVLGQENAALRAMDFLAATRLVEDKAQALADLMTHQTGAGALPPGQRRAAELARGRLEGLAIENRRLLETALQVQGRVIAVIARAAAREVERKAPCYGASGAVAARPASIAISAQA